MHSNRLSVIGAGRLGTTLMMYWHKKEIPVSGVYSLNEDDAHRAAEISGAMAFTNPLELIANSDFIWITVPDNVIPEVANSLATALAEGAVNCEGKIFCHTSGATPAKVLEPLKSLGANILSIHPLQSFAGWRGNPDLEWTRSLEETWFFVEGQTDGKHMENVVALMDRMENPWRMIREEQKALYHASACVASNYLVTLLQEAKDLLDLCGDIPADALMPLVRGTVDNFAQRGFDALTGPIARGDSATVEAHLAAMDDVGFDSTLYRMMAEKTRNQLAARKRTTR